jgi:hypothetical protein
MVRKMNTLTVRQNGSRARVLGRAGSGRDTEAGAVTGIATVARWVAVAGDSRVVEIPKYDCKSKKGMAKSIFLDLDDDDIRRLSGFLAQAELVLPDDSFEATLKELTKLLKQFNADAGTQYDILEPCSMPGHVATATGGCKPSAHGNTYMTAKTPIDPFFGRSHSGKSVFASGYVISVKYV